MTTRTVTFQQKWNHKRGAVTYRIGKEGTDVFLLLGADDLAELERQIKWATRGQSSASVRA